MAIRNMIKYSFLVLSLCILSGCSVPTSFYLRNLTDLPAKVILYPRHKDLTDIKYANEILEISKKTYQKLNLQIESKVVDDKMEIILPQNSTLGIGSGINIKNLDYYKIIIEAGNLIIELDDKSVELFNKKRVGLSKVAAWYDIE